MPGLTFGPTAREHMAKLGELESSNQLRRVQAVEAQQKIARVQALQRVAQEAARKVGASQSDVPAITGVHDSSNFMLAMGSGAAEVGDMEAAGRAFTAAARIQREEATADLRLIEQQGKRADLAKSQLAKLEEVLSVAKDDESLATANAMYAGIYGRPSPYVGRRYADVKDELDGLSRQVMDAKTRLDADLDVVEADRKERSLASITRFRKFRERMMEREQNLREGKEGRLKKHGGKVVSSPTGNEVFAVIPLLKRAMPDLTDGERLEKAQAVAAKAKQLRTLHPGLDADEANRQALSKVSRLPGVSFQDGSTAADALPIPPSRKFEVGRYYIGPTGVGKFNGTGFDMLPMGSEIDQGNEEFGNEE